MLRWVFLVLAIAAVPAVWGLSAEYFVYAAVLVLFGNFASFCLLYDRPVDRARLRLAEQARGLPSYSDQAQRLQTAAVVPTAADRELGYGPMVMLNLGTGVAAVGLVIWSAAFRMM